MISCAFSSVTSTEIFSSSQTFSFCIKMARFLRIALLVVAAIALAFPQALVSATPLDVASEGEGNSLRVPPVDGPSAQSYCNGMTTSECSYYCYKLGYKNAMCQPGYCRCYN